MTNQELEEGLARAVAQAAPRDLEGILSRCQEQNGKVIPMTKTKTAHPARWRALVAACLALALVGGGAGVFYQNANAVTSVVSIDVNPSIELRVNKDEKVLSCTPLNEEAHIVLSEMNDGKDLEGAKLTVAVNAIVGALVRHGYLDGLSNAILVSVEDKDQQRALRMEEELRSSISEILEAQAPNATLLSQTLTQEAGEQIHPISSGKAALVNQIMELSGSTDDDTFDKLSALTVEELSDLLTTRETRVPIGCAAAALRAEEYAGTLSLDSATTEVDPELDKKPAYYEVELHTAFGEFEYKVDAFTGEILSGPANVVTMTQQTFTPAPETSATPITTAPPAVASPLALIGEDTAWKTACGNAGCGVGDVQFAACKLDYEAGRPECYELEFCWNGNQYEYEIDCYTGAILKHEYEYCDETAHGHHGGTGTTTPSVNVTSQVLSGEDAAWKAACAHVGCKVGDVQFAACKLDYEDGRPECYELEFCWNGNQYEYEVDCYTGTILKHEYERCDEVHHGHHALSGGTSNSSELIGEDAAWSAVCNYVGCAWGDLSYSACELDYEDGVPHCYELEFCWNGNQYEYEIDCYSGEVLSQEWETCHNGLHGCGGGRHRGRGHHWNG